MLVKKNVAVLIMLAVGSASTLAAGGPQPPNHAQISYSFTCPSGASGHMSYSEDSTDKQLTQLNIWVNGRYLQGEPRVVAAVQGKHIDQLLGGCEGEKTTVLLRVSTANKLESNQPVWVTVLVDRSGQVVWVGV